MFCTAVASLGQNITPARTRPVQVADAIRMTQLADPEYSAGGSSVGRVAQFSSDRKHFVIVLKRGDLERNQNVYSLLLYETRHAFERPRPRILLTMSSSSNDDAIASVKWLQGNDRVAFLGETPGHLPQVYLFNLRTRSLTQLTFHRTPILAYDISGNGKRLIYIAQSSGASRSVGEWGYRDAKAVATEDLFDVLTETSPGGSRWSGDELYVQDLGWAARKIDIDPVVTDLEPPVLSPDGDNAILLVRPRKIPSLWASYRDRMISSFATRAKEKSSISQIITYVLLNIESGKATSLVDAPLAWENYASAWAPDGRSVVLSGTYLPLDVDDAVEREIREKVPYVVEVKLPEKRLIKITDKPLKVLSWPRNADAISLGPDSWETGSKPLECYERRGTHWIQVAVASGDNDAVEVKLNEDMNAPPRIFVQDSRTKKESLLLDLNPQFDKLRFGKEIQITWIARNGFEIEGGLYLPVNYIPGHRYPLVIQTHSFRPDRFWIDGPWSSAFAAQPLAGRGFVVLQVGDPKKKEDYDDYIRQYKQTPNEGPFEMASYEGAIDNLDQRGIIDRKRVGIIGFSRTVYHVKYALTHSSYHFAVATVADGIDAGYFEYETAPGSKPTDEALNGGIPFGPGLDRWRQNAPGFNLDRVNSPVRIEAYGLPSVLEGWEWFVGLSGLNEPVDFILLRGATHVLVRPWDRMISQEGNVDWFAFWLRHEEDPGPRKRAQYERWRKLRDRISADPSN